MHMPGWRLAKHPISSVKFCRHTLPESHWTIMAKGTFIKFGSESAAEWAPA